MIIIAPLNNDNLLDACNLVDKVFAYDELLPSNELKASLDSKKFKEFKKSSHHKSIKFLNTLEYYVAFDTDNNKVVWTTGIYTLEPDKDKKTARLWWFCVDEEYRWKWIWKMLIDFTINKSIEYWFNSIKLYTSDHPSEQVAQELYEKKWFYVTNDVFERDWDYILFYREKKLTKNS